MTALNFVLCPDHLCLVTDTLVTIGPQKRPYLYISKFQVLPHLNAIVTGTGQGLFGMRCYEALALQVSARDIVEADATVPEIYRELWQQHIELCRSRGDDMSDAKATIYHFGWVPSEGRIVGLQYKAENDFASTRIGDGAWLHPDTVDIVIRHPDDLIRITQEQKAIDDALSPEQRAGIGGDFHQVLQTSESITIRKVFRSKNFNDVFDAMNESFQPANHGK